MDDVLNDALSNLEHDNYERSHKGYENRQADIALIRAALAAQPAVSAEPAAWMKADGSDVWTGAKKLDAMKYAGAPGAKLAEEYCIPLAAPVAAQKADDALRAIKKIFDKPVTFVGDGPNSTVVVPFESHTQAWNHWHEAREIIDAAIAQQRQEGK